VALGCFFGVMAALEVMFYGDCSSDLNHFNAHWVHLK